MATFTKRYWGRKAKAFLEGAGDFNPRAIRQYRYRIRETCRRLLSQTVNAITHPEIRDKRLLAYLLDKCEEALRKYGYKNEAETLTPIREKIIRDYIAEVVKQSPP